MPKWDFTKIRTEEQLQSQESAPVSVQKTQKGPKWDFTKGPGTDQVVPQKPDQVPEAKSLQEAKPRLEAKSLPETKPLQEIKLPASIDEQPQKNPLTQKLIDVVQGKKDDKAAHQEMLRLWNEKKAFASLKGMDTNVAPPSIPDHLREKMSKQTQHYWDDALRRWGTDEPYKPLYESPLPGKLGQFDERAIARGQQMLDPSWVKEGDMPSTGSTLVDLAADLFGTVGGFSMPIGAGGQTIQLGRAAATSPAAAKVLSKAPGKIATHAGRALEGAVGGAAYGAYRSGVEDLSPKEAAKMIIGEAALWAAGDVAFRGLFEDALPKALRYVKVHGQRFLKKNPKASMEELQKSIVKDVGMEWDSLDNIQKSRVVELANRAIEGKTLDQPLLPSGQGFTFRDLTSEEIIGRVVPERPLGLPEAAAGKGTSDEVVPFPAREVREQPSRLRDIERKISIGSESVGMGVVPRGFRGTTIAAEGPRFRFQDPEIERRFSEAHGIKSPALIAKMREGLKDFWQKASREFEHLPRGAEFAELRKDLLKLQKQKRVSTDRTIRTMRDLIDPLDREGYNLFERKVILDDLAEELTRGHDLPFGFTAKTLSAERNRLAAELNAKPEVQEAITKRKEIWDAIKDEYISIMESIGFDARERFGRENYFRHQVLEYANLRSIMGTGQKLKVPLGRGFLKQRKGSYMDINTNYLQAEFEVMAQMLNDIEIARTIKAVDNNYNIARQLQARFGEEWKNHIPKGYTTWQPREGNMFYLADSIPARLAEKLEAGALEQVGLTKEQIRKVLAIGGKREEFVVKEEVAKTLDNLKRMEDLAPMEQAVKGSLNKWKVWQLISPRRFLKYNTRNLFGDADAVFAGNPSAFKRVPKAVNDLYYAFKDNSMTPDMQDWFERGGMQSLFQAQELADVDKLKAFSRFVDNQGGILNLPEKAWKKYWQTARMSTDFREAILRYANYLEYLEQMKANPAGRPKNFGASIPEEIMALKDIKDRAFMLSNQLLGAYDQVGVIGQKLRNYLIPFWSWNEVNFRRYIQLFKNAGNNGELAEAVGRKALGTLARTPLLAMQAGKFLLKASAMWTALQVWNNTRFPEEEASLPEGVRRSPHIVLGTDEDGKVLYFDRLGAFSDFLEWFGLADAPAQVKDWLDGKKSLRQVAEDMVKAPANTLITGITPFFSMPAELLSGKQFFPDAFEPRSIRDNMLYIAQSFGLENEYKALAGLPSRGYKESLKSLLAYTSDPGQAAYYTILDEKQAFLEKLGKKGTYGGSFTPKSNALYNLKLAIRYQDKEAFEKYLVEYVQLGGTLRGLEQSLDNMDPLRGLDEAEKTYFVAKWLDNEGRKRLIQARKFYQEVIRGQQ